MPQRYGKLKFACYTTNVTMSIIGNLPPMLFLIAIACVTLCCPIL
jgi:hypothetical protein